MPAFDYVCEKDFGCIHVLKGELWTHETDPVAPVPQTWISLPSDFEMTINLYIH